MARASDRRGRLSRTGAGRRESDANADRLRLALRAARAGAFETDFERRTFWCSPEFVELVGRSMTFEEAAGDCWPVTHPDDADEVRERVRQGKRRKFSGGPIELRVLLPSGEARWIQIVAEASGGEAGGLPALIVGLVLDIDARKRQELALQEARAEAQANAERLALALDAADAGVFETNFVDRTFWSSPEFDEIVGRSITFEEAAQPVWHFVHPDDADHVRATVMRAKETGRIDSMEYRLVRPDGEVRWLDLRSVVHMEPGWEVGKVVGLMLDIDARKRQQLALSEARAALQTGADRFDLVLEASQAGVFETDYVRKRFWASRGFEELIGRHMTYDDAAKVVWDNVHPDDRQRVLDWAQESGVTGMVRPLEFRNVSATGEVSWVEVTGRVYANDRGETERVIGLYRNVDARKRQELALAKTREEADAIAMRLKLAMHAAKAGVFETDLVARTFWCSPEFVEIVGQPLTFEDASGIWPIMHPDDVDRVKATIQMAHALHTPAVAQWRVRLPSGDWRWIEASALATYHRDGRPEKLTGVIIDIDERKRQELALMEAERSAQQAAEAKSQFLANMSHEIRTPMNGVLGVLHLLAKEPLSEDGRHLLHEAQGCGQMLAEILNDIIDFSRIEAGRLELAVEPIDPAEILRSVAGMLRPQAEAKGLALRVKVEGEGWIVGDPVRLRQALFNLIGNAVKFTSRGHVEARLALTRLRGKSRQVRFEIEDTGVGIAEDAQAQLFQRFHQADGSTARRFGGSGLGLAITRALAEMMGGEVGFASREDEGSTFWFDVPALASEAAPRRAEAPAPTALVGVRILVVEDNPTNRLVVTKMLESVGAQVATAEDGLAGLDAVQTGAHDLVLMDVQMPRMDGVEATRRIRALNGPVARLPIVGLTANALAHQRVEYLAAGMDGLVAKPIAPVELLAEIGRALAPPAKPSSRPKRPQSA